MSRLAVIYNIWYDAIELLPYSLNCLRNHVDEVIIVHQQMSNYGEIAPDYEIISDKIMKGAFPDTRFTFIEYEPHVSWGGVVNETAKRNLGITKAKELGCTHFCCMDADEMWENFPLAKKQFFDSGAKGSIAEMWTFFKEPTLRFKNPDNYYVPFIFELRHDTVVGNNRLTLNGQTAICDPTRKPNQQEVVLIGEKMSHYSWVRRDINLKVRNSSAQRNIANSNRLKDYLSPNCGEGFYCADYQQKLIRVENTFNIDEDWDWHKKL